MKPATALTYFEAAMPEHGLSLQLSKMEEFIRYIQFCNAQVVFLLQKNDQQYFAFMQQGLFLGHPTLGYQSIEHYKEAAKANFPDARLFYEAKEKGCSSYADYKLIKEAGISDVQVFEKIKSLGYIDGYYEWKAVQNNTPLSAGEEAIENPYALYKYASAKAFTDYQHFKTAFQLGFTEPSQYAAAMEKGYKNAADYADSLQKGFTLGEMYYYSMEQKIRDVHDLNRLMELVKIETSAASHDERLLLSVISKLPDGKKVSINKLNELFSAAVDEYKYTDTQELPEWFTRSLHNTAAITQFLAARDNAKKYGTYDSEGEYFETKHLNQRKVVLDGANVAHAAMGNDKAKPMVGNMIKVVNKLSNKGFTEITIISDASLRHRLTDKERLEELEQICEYKEAPAETAADIFLIEFVKMEGCLLVTNDTFRDWKLKDKWVAENIDYYKMAFMIEGEKVLMPDLDNSPA